MNANKAGLGGLGILVTRPVHQAQAQLAAVEAAGGQAIALPLLDIAGPVVPADVTAALEAARSDTWWLFTSPNAVRWAARLSPPQAIAWPTRLAAAGTGTAAALRALGLGDIRVPAQDGAAGLLALAELNHTPKQTSITVVCGENSPPWLAAGLRDKGFLPRLICVYRRQPVAHEAATIRTALAAADAAIITSGSALEQLWNLTPAPLRPGLRKLQLAVPSARVVEKAKQLGFVHAPRVPQHVSDEEFVHALVQWRQNRETLASR